MRLYSLGLLVWSLYALNSFSLRPALQICDVVRPHLTRATTNQYLTDMRTFEINDEITVECKEYSTRSTWGHKARVLKNGLEIAKSKIRYHNRTWERFTYESILYDALEKSNLFTDEEITGVVSKFN